MRILDSLKTGMGIALLAAALVGLPSCGSDYALFHVAVRSTNRDNAKRDPVQRCVMTIKNEKGELVLDRYQLVAEIRGDSLARGCLSGQMVDDVALFDYSTSRTSGSLTFSVEALDGNNQTIQQGESAAIPVKPYPPEIEVSFAIK